MEQHMPGTHILSTQYIKAVVFVAAVILDGPGYD
jgi:hypothetical protein